MSESLLDFDSWPPGITQASVPANNNARRAEILAGSVLSATTIAEPVTPAERDIYIIPAAATGTQWATFDEGDLAIYYDATWTAFAPFEGLRKFVQDEVADWQFIGSAGWAAAGGGGGTYIGTAGRITVTGLVINLDPTYVGQTSIVTLGTIATGTWNATAISADKGGTGQTSYAVGDILYASSTTALTKLSVGINGEVLTLVAGVPAWATVGGGIPQNSQSTAYTLVISDANKHILHPSADTTARTFTIPANSAVAFPIGTAVTFVNQNAAGVVTIAITTDTMRLAGPGTTGSRTLAANGMATALKITSTEWIIQGTGLT